MRFVTVDLSCRAECANDLNELFIDMLGTQAITDYLFGYGCKHVCMPFPDVRFDITFIATESKKAAMHDAVKALIQLMEAQECLQTLAFTDEYTDEDNHVGNIVDRLDEKTVIYCPPMHASNASSLY